MYLYLRQMEFLFQRILKDAGKIDVCRFGGIVEPAGMERVFFTGLYRFSYSSISKGTITTKSSGSTWSAEGTEGSGQTLQSSSIRPMASCAMRTASSMVSPWVKQPSISGISTEYPGFFRVKNCRIENSVHNVTSPFIIQQTINVPSLNRPTLLVGNCRIVYAVLCSFRI